MKCSPHNLSKKVKSIIWSQTSQIVKGFIESYIYKSAFSWKGPECKLGQGSLFCPPKSLYSSTFPNLGGGAFSTEHFWLVKYMQRLQRKLFFVLNSSYHNASTCSYWKSSSQMADVHHCIVACKNELKTVIGFSYMSEPICLIFTGLDHGGKTNDNRLKQMYCSLNITSWE